MSFLVTFCQQSHLKLYDCSFPCTADRQVFFIVERHHFAVKAHDFACIYQVRLMDSDEKVFIMI